MYGILWNKTVNLQFKPKDNSKMKKIMLLAAAVVLASAAFSSCSGTTESRGSDETVVAETEQATDVAPTDTISAAEGVIDLKDDNKFRPGVKPGVVTVLDFNAVWCVPCKKLTPAFHQAADSFAGKVEFYSVDVDSLKATAEAYKVESVPTVVIIAPDGTSKTVVGLADFTKGATAAAGEELTATIYSNLAAMVAEIAGK